MLGTLMAKIGRKSESTSRKRKSEAELGLLQIKRERDREATTREMELRRFRLGCCRRGWKWEVKRGPTMVQRGSYGERGRPHRANEEEKIEYEKQRKRPRLEENEVKRKAMVFQIQSNSQVVRYGPVLE